MTTNRRELADTYENITGTKPPTKWTKDQLLVELDKVTGAEQQAQLDADHAAEAELIIDIHHQLNQLDDEAQPPHDDLGAEADTPTAYNPETVTAMCCATKQPKTSTWELAGHNYCQPGLGCKADQPTSNAPAMQALAQAKAAKKTKTAKPAKPADPTLAHQIHVVAHNPKKPGTKAEVNWQLYREGMTVQGYITACKTSATPTHPAGADMTYNTKKGYIKILTPADYADLMATITSNDHLMATQGHLG